MPKSTNSPDNSELNVFKNIIVTVYLPLEKYAGQEATVRTGHGIRLVPNRKIGKGVCQGCILSPCLFNLYAE